MKSVVVNGKTWTKKSVRELIETNDKAVIRGITLLYSFQTLEEQYNEETREHNGQGFSGVDAKFLSSLAKQIEDGKILSQKQIEAARKRMVHYSGQIYNYIELKHNMNINSQK